MAKHITPNQKTGELGENQVRGRFLKLGFQFDGRSRLEAGIDGIAEVMTQGQPMAKMIAVQIKSTAASPYSPNPLLLCPHDSCDSTIEQLAEEVLSMTKLNWNSTQMNQRLPIPIRAARKVGEVLKYVGDSQAISTDYRKYI